MAKYLSDACFGTPCDCALPEGMHPPAVSLGFPAAPRCAVPWLRRAHGTPGQSCSSHTCLLHPLGVHVLAAALLYAREEASAAPSPDGLPLDLACEWPEGFQTWKLGPEESFFLAYAVECLQVFQVIQSGEIDAKPTAHAMDLEVRRQRFLPLHGLPSSAPSRR